MSNARQLAANLPREGGLSNRNVIINGDFSISQRGDYASSPVVPSADGYYLDRWKDWGGVARTIQKLTASINGVTQNTLKYVCTTGATGTYMGARQFVEAINLQDGQQYTISCMMRTNNANARIRTYDFNGLTGGVTSDACPSDGNWHKITLTQTHTSGANPQVGFLIYSGTETTVDIATNDYVEVANFQCEVGDTATPFEHRSYGDELQRCSRYAHVLKPEQAYGRYRASYSDTGTSCNTFYEFPVEMRSVPTLTSNNMSSSTFQCYSETDGGFRNPTGAFTLGESSKRHVWMSCSTATASSGAVGMWRWNNNPSASMFFDAEL